jgi:predicted metal-dependent phosphoesterase TrpH
MIYPVDLQLHSTASDGADTPAALVELCAQRGLRAIALTDHDSVLGLDAAIAAGERCGVQIVPALEFSTRSEPARDLLDINILALGIRHHDTTLQATLERVIASRIEQKIRQIERLQSYGIAISVDEVLARAQGVPGRVHIAQVAYERNPQRFSSISDVFAQFLASDAPNSTYVARTFSLRVEEAIEVAHAARGIAVLAHPGAYSRIHNIDGVVQRLAAAGLDGIEVHYPYALNRGHYGASADAVAALVAHFRQVAAAHGLLVTGGSDYHGTVKPGILPGMAGLTAQEWDTLAARCGWQHGMVDAAKLT